MRRIRACIQLNDLNAAHSVSIVDPINYRFDELEEIHEDVFSYTLDEIVAWFLDSYLKRYHLAAEA